MSIVEVFQMKDDTPVVFEPIEHYTVEEYYSWEEDIFRVTHELIQELDNKRLTVICDHYNIDMSELREWLATKRKWKTNADRIRNMSDEELASLFGSTCDCDNACCFIHNKGVSCMNGCEAAWLEWLKKEVKDG